MIDPLNTRNAELRAIADANRWRIRTLDGETVILLRGKGAYAGKLGPDSWYFYWDKQQRPRARHSLLAASFCHAEDHSSDSEV